MKHFVEEKTRRNVRHCITAIRKKHNVTREKAEELFQNAISDSGTIDYLLQVVDEELEHEDFMKSP